MVISFVCLVPVRRLRPNMPVLYHVNGNLQRAFLHGCCASHVNVACEQAGENGIALSHVLARLASFAQITVQNGKLVNKPT